MTRFILERCRFINGDSVVYSADWTADEIAADRLVIGLVTGLADDEADVEP